MLRSTLFAAALAATALSLLAPVGAQGPEYYATTHPFSLPMTTSVRALGMGYHVAAVQDDGFANPAYAAMLTQGNTQLRYGLVDFANGPRLTLKMASAGFPIRRGDPSAGGLQISLYRTDSNTAQVTMPGAVAPVALDMDETDVGIMWGRRMSDRLCLGIGFSPVMSTRFNARMIGTGVPLLILDSKPTIGARFGAAYRATEQLSLGLVYDNYQERVDASGMLIGLTPVEVCFRSETWAIGASYEADPMTTVALEWQQYENRGGGSARQHSSWRLGAERRVGDEWAGRAGVNDGSLTAGVGYRSQCGRWRFDYAYLVNWFGSDFKPVFGASRTHMLVGEYSW